MAPPKLTLSNVYGTVAVNGRPASSGQVIIAGDVVDLGSADATVNVLYGSAIAAAAAGAAPSTVNVNAPPCLSFTYTQGQGTTRYDVTTPLGSVGIRG